MQKFANLDLSYLEKLPLERFNQIQLWVVHCNEPGREGGLDPTKTDDVYLLSFLTKHKHSPLTYNGLFNTVIIIVHQLHINPFNYSSMILLGYDNRRPTSAARTEAHPVLYCQTPNKPGGVRGLPASAAPNDLTGPRT